MAAVTALSIMPATAFAAGDIGTIFFSHTYDSNGNAMRYNSSANIGGYTAGGTGNYKYRMFVDGENAFCIQPGVPLKTGNTLKKASSDTWNALSANQKKAVGLALLYGYQGNRNNLSGSDDEKWLATQTLVWEFVTGCREATGSYNQTSTTVYSLHFGSNYANSGARAVYDQIVAMLREHNTIPSFMSGGKNDITKELAYKDGKYSITLTDSNGVLSDYSFSSSDSNVSVSKSGNKLTISSTVAISGSVRITAKRNNVPTVSSSAKLIAYGDPNLQDLVTGVENADTVSAYINIETPTGTIALKKTSEDGVVEGISFTIKGDNFNKTVKTGKDGSVSVEGLFPGTYTVTEQSIDRYEPQKTQTVTLIGGKTSTVTFSNTLKRGSLEIVKTSEDNLVEGMKFHLYGTSLSGLPVDEYAVTDKNGLAKFENVLISGDTPYVVEEVDTAVRYVVPASQTAPIEWNKVTKRSFDNVLKKFQVTVTKTDAETGSPQGDASLAGAVYGIYKGEELIDTYTTDENGQFTTKYYICDNDWTVREISPSEGYLLDTAIHKVGAEPELYTVELNSTANDVNEQVIKGNIALIKHTDNGETQIETPEEGAVFEVFLKSAGSYENAKETERDVLTCDENGFAQTKDMPYGIYTVRQTFGWEGRELMKDFDVFISKDGQTYRYLINNANFESYIKIVKKDAETGNTIPYAGAGFQIYDPNGNLVTMTFTYPEVTTIDTFYTTADGDLITPQTLEYGKGYSLVEVQAPYGYVLNSEPVYFDVVQENSEEESGITVIEVVRSNMAQKGTITVEKSGEVFSSVAGDKGLYQPIFSVSGLEGAVYEITAAEDIVTLDGTVRANKGEVVDTVTTGKDGTVWNLEKVIPKDLSAAEISVRLGATWIPQEDIQRFVMELLTPSSYAAGRLKVRYTPINGDWFIENKSSDMGNVKADSTYGTKRASAYRIIEDTLNLRDTRIFDYVYDEHGNKKAVFNAKETTAAQAKQEVIKQAFQDWIWKDPERRNRLVRYYNDTFNSVRPREYDGSHITFGGISPEITLRPHQVNAIAHILYGGNTLLAHKVGAGKTFEMVAAAQENKRLGLCQKSMFVVPNHLVGQWASEYLRLYPSANILVTTKRDFETGNRKKFCGRIATGDYDAVIIGHSQFEKIPMSIGRQREQLEKQLDDIEHGIDDVQASKGEQFTVKQLMKTRKAT